MTRPRLLVLLWSVNPDHELSGLCMGRVSKVDAPGNLVKLVKHQNDVLVAKSNELSRVPHELLYKVEIVNLS